MTLGYGGIILRGVTQGDTRGIAFERADDRLFTVWFAKSSGALALADAVSRVVGYLDRKENGPIAVELEWQAVDPPKSRTLTQGEEK